MSSSCVGIYKWICTIGHKCLLAIIIIYRQWKSLIGVVSLVIRLFLLEYFWYFLKNVVCRSWVWGNIDWSIE